MRPLIQYELLESNQGGGGGSSSVESEFDQDMNLLNSDDAETGDDDGESESEDDTSGDEDNRKESRGRRDATRPTRGESDDNTEDSDEEEKEDDDEEGNDEELGDISEEEDEAVTDDDKSEERPSYARPPIKAIKEKYPNFFKDFPQLKAAFFGYPQFTEVFADIDSAREAATKAQEFEILEKTLVTEANPSTLLKTLSENNPKALKKMVSNFGESLRSVDSDAYIQLTTPIIEELLYHAAAHGSKIGNRNLQLAARHMANFVFANGGEIPDISKKKSDDKPSEAEQQLQQERESYAKEKFEGALGDVLKNIEPDINAVLGNKLDGLTSFEKRQIIKEARAEVANTLSKDKAFQQTLRNLWKRASESGYSSESKSRIKRAWLDRAKLVAPQVRNRLKQEALTARRGSKREDASSGKEEKETKVKFKETTEKRTFPERGGRTPSGSSSRVIDPKKIDWKKTSDRDILDMK